MRVTSAMFLLVLALMAPALAAAPGELMCAGHQKHLWFVMPADFPQGGFHLCHHATDLEGPFYQRLAWLAECPVAMASWGDRVWLVFPSLASSPKSRGEVFTVQVQKNITLGTYISDPSGRLDIVAGLPEGGHLISLVGADAGPIALLLPDEHSSDAESISMQDQSALSPKLLQLREDHWIEMELPPDFAATGACMVYRGHNLSILIPAAGEPSATRRYDRDPAGTWTSSDLPLEFAHLCALISASGQAAAVLTDRSRIHINYLRFTRTLTLAHLPAPLSNWSIVNLNDGLALLESDAGTLMLREIHPLTGSISTPKILQVQPFAAGKLWQMTVVVGVTIAGFVMAFMIKPVNAKVSLGPGMEPTPLIQRAGALMIDMAPAGLLTAVILRIPPTDLLNVPLLTLEWPRSAPYFLACGLTVLHSTGTELFRMTSLGKALTGSHLVTIGGSRPRASRILLRGAVKCVVFFVPPLAVVALLNPYSQGLADLAARIVVVRAQPESTLGKPKGR